MVKQCGICLNAENDELHRTSAEHRNNCRLFEYQTKKSSLRNSRFGVELSIDVEQVNGFKYNFTREPDKKGCHVLEMTPATFKSHGNQVEFRCQIKNGRTKKQDSIVVTYAGVLHPFEPFSMFDSNNNINQAKFEKVKSGSVYTVKVRITLDENHVSDYKIPIFFSIKTFNQNEEKMETFSLARTIIVTIRDQEPFDEEAALEKSPFTNNKWEKVDQIVPPTRKIRTIADEFPIPKQYWRTFASRLKTDFGGVLPEILLKLQPGYVTSQNYKDFFHVLLWLEEVSATIGLSSYNMENVNLNHVAGSILRLKVPGLAEKRPSVIKGDFIEIKVHGDHTTYQGIIQNVGDKSVDIEGLHEDIVDVVKYQPDMEIDVRFVLGRIHFERMHQGVEQVVLNGFVSQLFPSERLLCRRVSEHKRLAENELFNKQIYNNREQITAVQKILSNTSKGAPYIVNGPPGTGKTVTIVEAIYHLKKLTDKKILVCAPANAACNMLTEKLATFCTKKELARIMSETCDTESIHQDIVKYCNLIEEDGEKVVVPFLKEKLKQYRIIVTTLVFAGKYRREFQPDIVFLDEAAQAREPEACCAIGLLLEGKQLVLAGDPEQLGPVVHSEVCRDYNYDKSLLERLLKLPLYENDSQNNFTAMLKLNFRSHREILRLPNQLFYQGQLKAKSKSANSDPLAKTHIYRLIMNNGHFNSNGSPIEYCSVLARERKEGRSPSYYNPIEVSMVQKYIKKLTSLRFPENSDLRVTPVQIGVVTPYIRQVYKIREALHPQFAEVEVGTTEAFQGREKRVIIISTVRAQADLLLEDKKYNLGFVQEPKRFNVAITRAISKLIVVGNPLVLQTDEKWQLLMDQAINLGTMCGAPYPKRNQAEIEEIERRFGNFNLDDAKRTK